MIEAILNNIGWHALGFVGCATPEQWEEYAKSNPYGAAEMLNSLEHRNFDVAMGALSVETRKRVQDYLGDKGEA